MPWLLWGGWWEVLREGEFEVRNIKSSAVLVWGFGGGVPVGLLREGFKSRD